MGRGDLRKPAREAGVRRVLHVVRVDERTQTLRRGVTADPRDVRLHDVERPPREKLAETEDTEFGLATGERDRLRAADELVAVDVVGKDRLLDEGEVVLRDLMADLDRHRGVVGAVHVGAHLDVRPDRLADRAGDGDVGAVPAPLRASAELDLDRAMPLRDLAGGLAGHRGGFGRVDLRAVDGDACARCAAERLVERDPLGLRDDVPERAVDAAHRLLDEAAVVAPRPQEAEALVPDAFDIAGVAAFDDGPEELPHDGVEHLRRAPGDALAPAGDPIVGRERDDHRLEGRVRPRAELDVLALGLEHPGLELRYLHDGEGYCPQDRQVRGLLPAGTAARRPLYEVHERTLACRRSPGRHGLRLPGGRAAARRGRAARRG